ncbi:MAG: hypothetical protein COV72_03225 [Candidatus Omnitrophica bacterium CG11_big_fil_rev_8_21_14_0_20_42_13]|uniref:Response regulatory domain-containing protein n=1 Tax=Candidatus Ghiorseimicrobium undicola TaxID=1974746 RepID=A0A2H0LYB0_9BACT|nr:MAG: hypothetical protein COV72_03225 [Candidatus Omnitrophica bacterium CG11_big_fil_rev_8_21_14_0_20_42_13]
MENKRILIVDDEIFFLQLIDSMLKRIGGYEVMTLINTHDLVKRINDFKPDIIFLDIVMPEADGIEACRKLKNELYIKDIPVIMLSAMSRDEDKKRAFEAGADDFIAKPVTKEILISKIDNFLGRKE